MTGLFNKDFEVSINPAGLKTFGDITDIHLEKLFSDLESVVDLKLSLESFKLHSSELSLAEIHLDNIKSVEHRGFHLEAHRSKQENLILRCENVLKSLWSAISKLFEWISDSIGSLFGSGSSGSITLTFTSNFSSKAHDEAFKKLKDLEPRVDSNLSVESCSLGGLGSILNLDNKNAAKDIANLISKSCIEVPEMGGILVAQLKKLLGTNKLESAEKEFSSFIGSIKKFDVRDVRPLLKDKHNNDFVYFLQDRRTVSFFGMKDKDLEHGTITIEESEEKIKMTGGAAYGLLLRLMSSGLKYTELSNFLLKEMKPQAQALKGLVEKIGDSENDKEFTKALRSFSSCLRTYMSLALKITRQTEIILKAISNPEESLKPFLKKETEAKN